MATEKVDIEGIRTGLRQNPYFQKLTTKQQESLLTQGRWRLASWKRVAVDAGFSAFLADQMYGFLSHYAHSGSASLLQLASEPAGPDAARMVNAMLRVPLTVAAHFLHDYCELIDSPQVLLSDDEKLFLYPWIKLGSFDLPSKQHQED